MVGDHPNRRNILYGCSIRKVKIHWSRTLAEVQRYREELGCWRYESEKNLAGLRGADSGAEEALLGRLSISLDCRKTSVLLSGL